MIAGNENDMVFDEDEEVDKMEEMETEKSSEGSIGYSASKRHMDRALLRKH